MYQTYKFVFRFYCKTRQLFKSMFTKVKANLVKAKNWFIMFFKIFVHDIAKHFYKQFFRATYLAWSFFTFFIAYQVFIAGAIQLKYNPEIKVAGVTMTGQLASQMVTAFYLLWAISGIAAIYSTILFARDWRGGKRIHTLRSIDKRLTAIEGKIGIFNSNKNEGIGKVNKDIRHQLEKIRKRNLKHI